MAAGLILSPMGAKSFLLSHRTEIQTVSLNSSTVILQWRLPTLQPQSKPFAGGCSKLRGPHGESLPCKRFLLLATLLSRGTPVGIDFQNVAGLALANANTIVEQFLPGGKYEGSEYVTLNPTRADAHPGSFKVN